MKFQGNVLSEQTVLENKIFCYVGSDISFQIHFRQWIMSNIVFL